MCAKTWAEMATAKVMRLRRRLYSADAAPEAVLLRGTLNTNGTLIVFFLVFPQGSVCDVKL